MTMSLGIQGWINTQKSPNIIHYINISKKVHYHLSIYRMKIFNKIEYLFTLKREENFLNPMKNFFKTIYSKHI